ncbi:MAG: nuclear transport factor 2 family protein [Acidobacteria bacterium]|nr:MAG: nuclear transport factor 2 family protein [Acidobacteriota bacterium]REK09146.1 MAG: nuclear transport factor 2 family protein [Acidobacteriota bacterium]
MSVAEIGKRLVELCQKGENRQAVEELYADEVVTIEGQGSDEMPARMEGKDAVRGKHDWWESHHEVHDATAEGPFCGHRDDQFAVLFGMDVTHKQSGQRIAMREVALFTVADGKIVQEEFLYQTGD